MKDTVSRNEVLKILRGLLYSENLGDVHDQVILLSQVCGVPEPAGDYLDGFQVVGDVASAK